MDAQLYYTPPKEELFQEVKYQAIKLLFIR